MLDNLKRAARITVVLPYYGYAARSQGGRPRADHGEAGRESFDVRALSGVLTLDLHAAQIQGFFDIPVDHLYASPVIMRAVKRLNIDTSELIVLSPDEGSVKRTISEETERGTWRSSTAPRRAADRVEVANLIAVAGRKDCVDLRRYDFHGRHGRQCRARLARSAARAVYVFATHGVLCGDAMKNLRGADREDHHYGHHSADAGEAHRQHRSVDRGGVVGRRHCAFINQSISELFV